MMHPEALISYREGTGHTVINAHVSPTAACNLSCPYCAYQGRDKTLSLSYDVLTKYTDDLLSRGLKAIVLTGGGEPLLYPKINEYIEYCSGKGLKIGLITNGFMHDRLTADSWSKLTWVRVSVNMVDGWLSGIRIPKIDGVVGMSVVYQKHTTEDFSKLLILADEINAEYVRVFPDYNIDEWERNVQYREIRSCMDSLVDPRLTILNNHQRAPSCRTCHLSYFRPYLAEDGRVYQCCVSILSNDAHKLTAEHALCWAGNVLDFIDHKIPVRIVPERDCSYCTYADQVESLDAWSKPVGNDHDLFV